MQSCPGVVPVVLLLAVSCAAVGRPAPHEPQTAIAPAAGGPGFELAPGEDGACGSVPDYLTVSNQWISGTQVDSACTKITAGPALDVQSGGDLTLKVPLVELA